MNPTLLLLLILLSGAVPATAAETTAGLKPGCPDAQVFSAKLITDICWSCVFPIRIAGISLDGGNAPAGATRQAVCACDDPAGVPEPGLVMGFWAPARLIEVVRLPYCAPSLQAQQTLLGEPSPTGEAYRTVSGNRQRAHPDLSHDPIWGSTDQTLGHLDALAQTFADCTVTTNTQSGSFRAYVPDYRTCERAPRLGKNQCTLTHTLALNPLPPFTVSVGAWGSVTNTFRFDLKEGSWRSVAPSDGTEFTAQMPVLDPAQVCPATARTRIQFRRATDWPDVPVGGDGEFDDTTD